MFVYLHNEEQPCPLLHNILLELTIATGKPQSVPAGLETVHFRGRKGTRVVLMLNAKMETCTYQTIIHINYLSDIALNNFRDIVLKKISLNHQ